MKDCLAWLIWWEHNNRTFEDTEISRSFEAYTSWDLISVR